MDRFLCAQPYVDPIQVRYMNAFRSNNTPATPFTHLWAGSDLPIRLKGDAFLLLSPFYEQWSIDSADTEEIYPTVHSIALPVGLIMPFRDSNGPSRLYQSCDGMANNCLLQILFNMVASLLLLSPGNLIRNFGLGCMLMQNSLVCL